MAKSGKPTRLETRAAAAVEDVSLAETARTKYLNYALSVITSRALPDVRDGLKPVQRRILYAMWADLRVRSDTRFIKSAAVVGEVMKSYHPHGDQSIYDALVRMSQNFTLRDTLIEGYGNFGSIDGDPPAAMRYTEARLTKIAEELLSELREQTVDFRANYSATTEEPVVLPARFPNLLVNGASGIAVGMATNIPPHNLREVCNALLALLDNRDTPVERLLKHIAGPDFPTGGVVLNSSEEFLKIYSAGQGTIKLRGSYQADPERKDNIIITSIPFGVEKDALVERIGELIGKGQVPQLTNVKDLSTDDIRIMLEIRPGANIDAAMAYLFKNTPLQSNFHVNMTCLLPTDDAEVSVPDRLDLKSMLLHFLDFRMEIVTRRLQHELRNLQARIHILEGFEIVFNNLDEAIRIIRNSDGKADAAPKLIARFRLTEIQADAILETKLYRLGKLEIKDIVGELEQKRARAAEVEALLQDESSRWRMIRSEIKQLVKDYGTARRTQIVGPVQTVEFREEDYIVDEDAWVIITRDGWIKRQKNIVDVKSIRLRDGDQAGWVYRVRATQTITIFTNRGIAYTIRANDLVMTAGHGEPASKLFAFEDNERIVGVVSHDPRCLPTHVEVGNPTAQKQQSFFSANGSANGHANGHLNGSANGHAEVAETDTSARPPYAVAVTAGGKTLRFSLDSVSTVSNKKGRVIARLDPAFPNDEVVGVEASDGTERVLVVTRLARAIVYRIAEVNVVSGAAKGVMAIRVEANDRVLGFQLAGRDGKDVATILARTNRGSTMEVRSSKVAASLRGGKGQFLLQRGSLEAILLGEAKPVPALES